MINRIRDIRQQKNMTLADVAAACNPPTTAQTIGRLETGMRSLSLTWMNRIAAALDVNPELLVRSEERATPQMRMRLAEQGVEALPRPIDAALPTSLAGGGQQLAIRVDASSGAYCAGDTIWLREIAQDNWPSLVNRDVLAPIKAGRYGFGRLALYHDGEVVLHPSTSGAQPITIEHPAWLAVAEMLIRPL